MSNGPQPVMLAPHQVVALGPTQMYHDQAGFSISNHSNRVMEVAISFRENLGGDNPPIQSMWKRYAALEQVAMAVTNYANRNTGNQVQWDKVLEALEELKKLGDDPVLLVRKSGKVECLDGGIDQAYAKAREDYASWAMRILENVRAAAVGHTLEELK